MAEINNQLVPVFTRQSVGKNEFSIVGAAEIHDNAMQWLHDVHNTSEEWLRNKLVDSLDISAGENFKILVTSAGAGNDLPYLLNKFKGCDLYVQDIAYEMLETAITRNSNTITGRKVNFFVGDACDLPFDDQSFDIVFHFGGINLFENVRAGINEMHRVAKIGGVVQFGDEGIAPWMYEGEISKVLITNNALYSCKAPLSFLPLDIKEFRLQYLFNNCFYLVRYIKSTPMSLNLDVEHKGRRGGSLRTRFYGGLEGVDPQLKDEIYSKAEKSGMSRVSFLENVLRKGIASD